VVKHHQHLHHPRFNDLFDPVVTKNLATRRPDAQRSQFEIWDVRKFDSAKFCGHFMPHCPDIGIRSAYDRLLIRLHRTPSAYAHGVRAIPPAILSQGRNAVNKFTIVLVALVAANTAPALASKAHVGYDVVPDGIPYRAIHTAGLDLSSSAVVRKLQMRVRWAAEAVCPDNLEIDDIVPSPERRACLNNAIGKGFAQIESKHLAALNSANATSTIPTSH
jgi:UrcA family protein